jgi:hypothetical protein
MAPLFLVSTRNRKSDADVVKNQITPPELEVNEKSTIVSVSSFYFKMSSNVLLLPEFM